MLDGNLVLICDTEKGPEMQLTSHYLSKMGYRFYGPSRGYFSVTTGLTMGRSRGIDIPSMIDSVRGNADIGIVSGAVIDEVESKAVKLLDLPYGNRTLHVYVNQTASSARNIDDLKSQKVRVLTSWPNTAAKYCVENNIEPEVRTTSNPNTIMDSESSVIGIEYIEPQDIFDNHVFIGTRDSPCGALIANPRSYEQHGDMIDGWVHRLQMAMTSEGWRLLKFNVPQSELDMVKGYLPAMNAPTYANLLGDSGWCAVEAALPNGKIEEVIGQLKKNTEASGFLDIDLGGVEL